MMRIKFYFYLLDEDLNETLVSESEFYKFIDNLFYYSIKTVNIGVSLFHYFLFDGNIVAIAEERRVF